MLFDNVGVVRTFLNLFLIPLSFLPVPIRLFLSFLIGFFELFFVGKFLKWLWDLLPVV